MKPIKIFLAVVVIMLASSYLNGCSAASSQGVSEEALSRLQEASEMEKSVLLTWRELPNDEYWVVELVLDNPERQPITSAETWISYQPDLLRGVELIPNETDFELQAPYENGFDPGSGLLRIGRATATPIDDEKIVLAELYFEKLTDHSPVLESFLSHSSVNMVKDGQVVDLLLPPQSPLVAYSY